MSPQRRLGRVLPAKRRPAKDLAIRTSLATGLVLATSLMLGISPTMASYQPGIPPAVDPGTPVFAGLANPVPAEPAAYDPSQNMMQAIFDADVAAGGTSYWFDRILARPFSNASGESSLMTRGRALYMYTHAPGTLGFAGSGTGANGGGGYAYRQPPTTSVVNLYTLAISGATLTETTAQRMQFPSYYSALFTATGLSVAEKKFITDNNVAVTNLTITNTGATSTTRTITATSPIATTSASGGTELTGTVNLRYGLSTIFPRMSGDGFAVSGTTLTRSVTLAPGASVSLKVQLGAIANEIPESTTDYQRFKGYDPDTAWLTQMKEYNRWWADNVPYVDYPNANVKKISYYRTWENRYNMFDGNIPGNDYQFPADLEGALGYNNQISLTVPMRLQDLKFWRDPLWSYGPWLSQGEESGCAAYHDNPGNTGNWNNTYEQWTSEEAWKSFLVHGGPPEVVALMAKYAECDVKGMLAKFDSNHNNLIEYTGGTLPGNDADSVAFKFYGGRAQDRTESSFWYSSARAAAAEYDLVGNTAKAAEMNAIADGIKASVNSTLWADGPVGTASGTGATGPRVSGQLGNAVKLNGSGEYVRMPTGIVSGLNGDFTISTWVNPSATTTWSRIFDFGTGQTANMFLTVSAGSGPRFAITTSGGGGEQQINRTGQLPLNTWSHIAVTLSGNTGTMYINGVAVGTNTNITLRPSNLGNTANNWIGRSQYSDPFLGATVDDFQIYGRALSASEVADLAAGNQGAGDAASYRFDEASGADALDSSGNGRTATIVSPTITNSCPGKVYLQKDLTTGNLVCWKDQQNFAPFIDGIAPNDDNHKQALRYYADAAQFPIMPVYTANQADEQSAVAFGTAGSNNFSNINETLQARLYSTVLRDYPSQYVTPDMYRKMIEWQSWIEYINHDNRFPDNNEFFSNWNPSTQTFTRSSIHHDVLGSFNWAIFEDVAGLQARADDILELYPIDMGLDHFTVNNLSYHGSNLTIVWQKPGGTTYYPSAPAGYSAYLDGQLIFTADDLAHLTWDSHTGQVDVLDGSATTVTSNAAAPLLTATQVGLTGNARVTDAFQKAGLDLKQPTWVSNLALGKPATASFTSSSSNALTTAPANAVDGYTISAPPVSGGGTVGGFVSRNPIWGTQGSPNSQDWLQIDLGTPTRFNDVKLYFYDNKAFGTGGNTYRAPTSYTIQTFNGSTWVDVPGQAKSPGTPAANFNEDKFPSVTAQLVRVLANRASSTLAIGVKEFQVFDTDPAPIVSNDAPAAGAAVQYSDGLAPTVTIAAVDHNSQGSDLSASAVGLPSGLSLAVGTTSDDATLPGTRTWTVVGNTGAAPGSYPVTVTVTDETAAVGTTSFTIVVSPEDADATYTGDELAFTSPGGSSVSVVLRATIRDSSLFDALDTTAGDIRTATVTFKEGGTVLCGPLPVQLIGAESTIGSVSCVKSLGIGSHQVDIFVGGRYVGSSSALVEIASPDGSFITGGGFRNASNSAGTYATPNGGREQFGFNVKYNKNFTNLQGHLNVIFVSAGRTYQAKSTSVDALGIVLRASDGSVCTGPPSASCSGIASLRTKANLVDITDPQNPVSIGGNLTLQMTMTDRGEPGAADTIGITLWNGNSLLFSSEWNGSTTVEGTLGGGNLVAH